LKWLTLTIAGQQWAVHLVRSDNPNLRAGDDHYDGRCLFAKRRIYINKNLDEVAQGATLLHEINHVIVRESGAYEVLESALPPGDAGRVDEAFVSVGSPHLHCVLTDLGFRFPRPVIVGGKSA
jgi:hypothetical protein